MKKYRVLTDVSSFPDGRPLLHETNSLRTAQKEAREWANFDQIFVWVKDTEDKIIFAAYPDDRGDGQTAHYATGELADTAYMVHAEMYLTD